MKLSEQFERNQMTIEEAEAVLEVLDQKVRSEAAERAKVKLRWNIAASRNEVEYD